MYLAWSRRNRSALIRVPLYHPGKEQASRAELRCPDPACNPYLAATLVLLLLKSAITTLHPSRSTP